MQSRADLVVILGSGGTIAGVAARADDHVGYQAASLGVSALARAVPGLQGLPLETEQVAQLDSRNMDLATWLLLAQRAAFHLARPEVSGLVLTHGTDTLEETAYFLHRVLHAAKPVVLTAAMRPATALSADGPQNLFDAVTLARVPGACGVMAVLGGQVFAGQDLRKVHGYRVDAFSAGDAGLLGLMENASLRRFRDWPQADPHPAAASLANPAPWPQVAVLISHAGASADVFDAVAASGVAGIVIAGTGNGSVHHAFEAAAQRARAKGLQVWRSSRCQLGGVVGRQDRAPQPGPDSAIPSAGVLTAVQARIELMLDLRAGA